MVDVLINDNQEHCTEPQRFLGANKLKKKKGKNNYITGPNF